jgi:3-hydroxybutyryl-CoA dehydrogenase
MKLSGETTAPILLVGEGNLLASVAVCLVCAGHDVKVFPANADAFTNCYNQHVNAKKIACPTVKAGTLKLLHKLSFDDQIELAIAILPENLLTKIEQLQKIEAVITSDAVIAMNTETYSLADLERVMKNSDRLVGLNWTEPAHTTLFLEIVSNGEDQIIAQKITALSKHWGKDAYIVKNSGIRSLLVGAMAREASFLVDNGYASVDDIDRACRNDAGYYLPFSGNCRYMDLMGTYAYGMVMKDLNPELSKDNKLPQFFEKIKNEGALGMENNKGFYNYTEEEAEEWKETMEKFSYEIQKIIEKYPFNYDKESYLD